MTLVRDDGAVIYVNGQEVNRVNLPKGQSDIVYTNLAVTNVTSIGRISHATDTLKFPRGGLITGTNIISVEIHQAIFAPITQFDIGFDLEILGFPYSPGPSLSISASNSVASVRWPDYLVDWNLQQSSDLITWEFVEDDPIQENNFFVLRIPANDRRFYRLQKP
jgi:hypothetical protein